HRACKQEDTRVDDPLRPGVTRKPRSRFLWRWLRRLFAGMLLLALGLTGWKLYEDQVDRRALERYLAELDQEDPGWRFEEIEAARPEVPDAENSAQVVAAVAQRLPEDWQPPLMDTVMGSQPPPQLLDRRSRHRLEAVLAHFAHRG